MSGAIPRVVEGKQFIPLGEPRYEFTYTPYEYQVGLRLAKKTEQVVSLVIRSKFELEQLELDVQKRKSCEGNSIKKEYTLKTLNKDVSIKEIKHPTYFLDRETWGPTELTLYYYKNAKEEGRQDQ